MKFRCPPVRFTLGLLLLLASSLQAGEQQFQVTVKAGQHDRTQTPVVVPVTLDDVNADQLPQVTLTGPDGKTLPGQLTRPGLLSEAKGENAYELHFILPELKAGQTAQYTAKLSQGDASPSQSFQWKDTAGEYAELLYGDRPVLRYMYHPLDESSAAAREQTYKVFHHLYDPVGTRFVTKGAGGQFTHHRGLFYGFNKITYDGNKSADVWHARGDAHQSHEGFLSQEAGPVLGRHRVAIDWHGQNKEVFAKEEREIAVYQVPGGQLVEFASRLKTTGGPVRLDGDPQHAGFHFRAAQEVAEKTKGQTYYIRPDGVGKPGETRNWPGQKDQVNFPWKGMSFVLGDQRYTAAYIDRPENPKEARFSERDYGRFGSYFEYNVTEDQPLELNYRVWLEEGEMTPEDIAELANDFVEPVQAEIKPAA